MASVDSGVETGNESNDDPLELKHDSRPEKMALVPVPFDSYPGNIEINKVLCNSHLLDVKIDAPESISFPNLSPSSSLPQNFLFYNSPSDKIKSDQFSLSPPLESSNTLVRYEKKNFKMKDNNYRRMCRNFMEIHAPVNERKLRLAACTNNIELVQHLLFLGVNPNCCDSQRRAPLHLSASRGYADIVRLLLEYGANPNQQDSLGNTPLHLAACNNNLVVVTLLLKAGTDVSSSDKCGRNPLQLAQSKLRLLHKHFSSGVDMHIKSQVYQVIEMMLEFLHKRGQETEAELLSAFSSRLTLSETKEQVETQVRDLLESLSGLSLESTSKGNSICNASSSSSSPSSCPSSSSSGPNISSSAHLATRGLTSWVLRAPIEQLRPEEFKIKNVGVGTGTQTPGVDW